MTEALKISFMMIILLGLMTTGVVEGQDVNVKIGLRDSIKSEILHGSSRILIHLPDNYGTSNKSYPVMFRLNGNPAMMLETVSAVNRLALDQEIIPEMIIVSIETISGKDMWPVNTKYYPEPETLGANNFLSFIEKELIPYVEKRFRTNGDRILYGQSMTAVFTIYAFLAQPKLFNSYIACSGAFPDCEAFFKEFSLKSFQQTDQFNGRKIFITNGLKDELDPDGKMNQTLIDFSNSVKDKLGNRVLCKYLTYEDEGHVPFYSLYDGLKYIYKTSVK